MGCVGAPAPSDYLLFHQPHVSVNEEEDGERGGRRGTEGDITGGELAECFLLAATAQ